MSINGKTVTINRQKLVDAWVRTAIQCGIDPARSGFQLRLFQTIIGTDFSVEVVKTFEKGLPDEN